MSRVRPLIRFAAVLALVCSVSQPAGAQVVTDGTLGPAQTITPRRGEYVIGQELGTRRGPNLFHSFESFSPQRTPTFFVTGAEVSRLISRVTGPAETVIAANVLTTLDTAPRSVRSVDFFLLNPNGIRIEPFGKILNGSGDIALSAGDALVFADGARFSTDTGDSTLTVAAPEAFGFLGRAAGPISIDLIVEGTALDDNFNILNGSGGDIALAAGTLEISSGVLKTDRGGRLSLLAGTRGDLLALDGSATAEPLGGTLTLTGRPRSQAEIDAGRFGVEVVTEGGGILTLQAGRIALEEARVITRTDSDSAGTVAPGRIRVRAGTLTLDSRAQIVTSTRRGEGGTSALTVSTTGDLALSGGSSLATFGTGTASAGPIRLDVGGTLALSGTLSAVTSETPFELGGETFGRNTGDPGPVTIVAAGPVTLSDNARIGSLVRSGDGSAGTLRIDAESLTLSSGGQVASGLPFTRGEGAEGAIGTAGRVEVRASRRVAITGRGQVNPGTGLRERSGIFVSSESIATRPGRAGTTRIEAPLIALSDGGAIAAESISEAQGGGISVVGFDRLILDGGASITSAATRADAGNVVLRSPGGDVLLLDGSQVTGRVSRSGTLGDGGNVTIDSRLIVVDTTSEVTADARGGDGGNLSLTARGVFLEQGAVVDASSDLGIDGTVEIRGDEAAVTDIEVVLPGFLDPRRYAGDPCAPESSGRSSLAVVGGAGGRVGGSPTPGFFLEPGPMEPGTRAARGILSGTCR